MTLSEFQVEAYRSLRSLHLRLKRITIIIGANGSGKSNLYKSLRLLAAAAHGNLARSIVDEGGMPSVLWSGELSKKEHPRRLKLTIKLDGGLKYHLALGLPQLDATNPFPFDPLVKEEQVSWLSEGEKTVLFNRKAAAVDARDSRGKSLNFFEELNHSESILSQLSEPHRFPELSALRQEILSWRFYHRFRTDEESLLRQEQSATYTACLNHDGSDLAAALRTIDWVGDGQGLKEAVDNAFPGACLDFIESGNRIGIGLRMPGFSRSFNSRELSDGTLHYLCLLAALNSPRPAKLIALNEPEVSIHPDLLPALSKMLARAAKQSQLWIITHSMRLAELLSEDCHVDPFELHKVDGESKLKGYSLGGV